MVLLARGVSGTQNAIVHLTTKLAHVAHRQCHPAQCAAHATRRVGWRVARPEIQLAWQVPAQPDHVCPTFRPAAIAAHSAGEHVRPSPKAVNPLTCANAAAPTQLPANSASGG